MTHADTKATERPTLRQANIARQAEWDAGNQLTLAYRGNELAGEVGEACNIIKKIERERLGIRGSRDTLQHLAEELADVVICTDLIAMAEGIDLDAAVAAKFNATSEKNGLATRFVPSADPALQDKLTKAVKALEQCATPFTLPNIDDLSGDALEKSVAIFRCLVEHALAVQTAANTVLRSIKESE